MRIFVYVFGVGSVCARSVVDWMGMKMGGEGRTQLGELCHHRGRRGGGGRR